MLSWNYAFKTKKNLEILNNDFYASHELLLPPNLVENYHEDKEATKTPLPFALSLTSISRGQYQFAAFHFSAVNNAKKIPTSGSEIGTQDLTVILFRATNVSTDAVF